MVKSYGNVVFGVVLTLFMASILVALGVMMNSKLSDDQWAAGTSGGTVYNNTLLLNSSATKTLSVCEATRNANSARIADATLSYVTMGNHSEPIGLIPTANFTVSGCAVAATAGTFVYSNHSLNFTYTYTYTADTTTSLAINKSVAPMVEVTGYYGLWILAGGIAFTVIMFSVVFLVLGGLGGRGDEGGRKLPKLSGLFKGRGEGKGSEGEGGFGA